MSCRCKNKRNCGSTTACATIEDIQSGLSGLQIAPDATVIQKGKGKLSYPAALKSNPIFVGDNEPLVRAARKPVYLEQYGHTLAGYDLAIAAIGSDVRELVISSQLAMTDNRTSPANALIRPVGQGSWTVSSGKTFTVSKAGGLEDKQYCFGVGNTVFARNATGGRVKLDWFTAAADIDHGMAQALLSVADGGVIQGGSGTWIGSGNWELPKNASFEGVGKSSDALGGTVIQLKTGSSATCIFKVKVGFRNNAIRTCTLDCLENGTNPNCAGLEFYGQGTYGVDLYSGFGFTLDSVLFFRGKYGRWIHDNALGGWELERLLSMNCEYIGQSHAWSRQECVNGSFSEHNPTGALRPGVLGYDQIHSGTFNVYNPLFNGEQPGACSGGNPNASLGGTCFRFTLSHGEVNIHSNQDEAVAYFIEVESALPGAINVYGSLSQSIVKFKAAGSAFLNIFGGTWYPKSIRAVPLSSARVATFGQYTLQGTDLCGVTDTTRLLCDFTGTGAVHTVKWPGDEDKATLQVPLVIRRSTQWNGITTQPSLALLDDPNPTETRLQLQIGRCDANGVFDLGYNLYRRYTDGRFQFEGNQVGPGYLGFNGVDFPLADLSANSFHGAELTVPQLTASQNDFFVGTAATDNNDVWKQTWNMTSNARWSITGFYGNLAAVVVGGCFKFIVNKNAAGSFPIDFPNEDTGSIAPNRILTHTGKTVSLWPGQMGFLYRYGSASTGRWHLWTPPQPDASIEAYWSANYNYVSTSTLTSIASHLDKTINVLTNGIYTLEMFFMAQAAVKGLQIDLNGGTAGWSFADGVWQAGKTDQSVLAGAQISAQTDVFAPTSLNVASLLRYKFEGTVAFTTAGTFYPRMAQQASDASNTGVFIGSWVKMKKLN